MTATVRYRVVPADPHAHRFEVSCLISQADGRAQVFRLPSWLRGSYLIRDFAKHVVSVQAHRAGQAVPLSRLDKRSVVVPAGSPGPLQLDYSVHAWDQSVRKAWLDARRGFFNGSSLFYCPDGFRNARFELELLRPPAELGAGWRVATTLDAQAVDADGFGRYGAENYEALIDHPVEMGLFERTEFMVDGVPHALVLSGRADTDAQRIAADLERICREQRRMFSGEPQLLHYLFLTRVVGSGYGGLEHRASTALICARSDLPRPGQRAMESDYVRFLGLCSHEYFHLWNVKRIVPAAFAESDLAGEAYTRDLWHYEGVTSYYDDLFLLRAGVIDAPTYLDLVARTATRLQRAPARQVQTLEDASFEAWIKFYQPDDNSLNQSTNYYVKGALLALCVDLHLRLHSGCTLDQLMQVLWTRYGREGRPVPEGELSRLAGELSGLDLRGFFASTLRSTDELPLAALLAEFAVRAELRPQAGPADEGGRCPSVPRTGPWLGLKLRAGEPIIATVLDGAPAQRAGLAAGDQLVAVDGLRFTAANSSRRFDVLTPEEPVRIDYFRDDELFTVWVTPRFAPADTWTLTLDTAGDDAVASEPQRSRLARRRAWLGG